MNPRTTIGKQTNNMVAAYMEIAMAEPDFAKRLVILREAKEIQIAALKRKNPKRKSQAGLDRKNKGIEASKARTAKNINPGVAAFLEQQKEKEPKDVI